MEENKKENELYGFMAEFKDPHEAVVAAEKIHKAGYRKIDAYSPYPHEELAEAIGMHHTRLPLLVLICGIIGGLSGFFFQYWVNVIEYPINIGGRPLFSWPSFIPVTFELTVLFAALSAVLGMIIFNGLPRPYHPVFNVDAFEAASRDRIFICIESKDKKFDRYETWQFLQSLNPTEVHEVAS